MSAQKIYDYLERIGNLMRAEARQSREGVRLQPVQLEILHYLSICNRFSNIPAAVTEYLGLTKGTVSQTLSVLADKGYIEKVPDVQDKRVTRLFLTEKGEAIVAEFLPPQFLQRGLALMSPQERQHLSHGLQSLLEGIQKANRLQAFGPCRECRHLRQEGEGYRCNLTQLPLTFDDTNRICREYSPVETAPDKVA